MPGSEVDQEMVDQQGVAVDVSDGQVASVRSGYTLMLDQNLEKHLNMG